jgi:hypothetical protein
MRVVCGMRRGRDVVKGGEGVVKRWNIAFRIEQERLCPLPLSLKWSIRLMAWLCCCQTCMRN